LSSTIRRSRADLEIQIRPEMLENAVNRFLSCSKALCINNVCVEWGIHNLSFLPRAQEDPLNCVRFSVETGIGGSLTGDRVILKLYLEGEKNRDLRIGYVSREGPGLIDLVPEFKNILMYIDVVNPVVERLPPELQLIWVVEKYLLKATATGAALIGVQLSRGGSDFLESSFHSLNQGPSEVSTDRFALAVKQNVIRDIITSSFQGYETEGVRIHSINRDNITFTSSELKVEGGLTYSSPCGLFNVNIDMDYSLTASFSNPTGDFSIRLNFGLSFANIGERIQATTCGIIEAIDSMGLPYLLVPAALAIISPIAYVFAEELANSMAGQQAYLPLEDLEGVLVERVNDRTWDITIRPVTALGKWGGLVWPVRFRHIDLNDDGRVVIAGNQDADPSTPGKQEAEFAGDIASTRNKWKFSVNERDIGLVGGAQFKRVILVKDGGNLASIIDWEIVDNPNRCFSTSHEPLISLTEEYNTPLMRDLSRGSYILSPQNTVKVNVTFGPTFQRYESSSGLPGRLINFIPSPGDVFYAKLKITYKVKDGGGSWQVRQLYIDLEGEITFGYIIEGPSIFTGPDILHVYVPDEIFHIAEEFEALDDLWVDLPPRSDFDLLHVYSLEPGIRELRVEDMGGALMAKASGSPDKMLTIAAPVGRDHKIVAEPEENIPGTHFYVQRQQLTPQSEIDFTEPVSGVECRGDTLAVSTGKEVSLYNITDLTRPVILGRSLFKQSVKVLQPIEEQEAFMVTDGETIQIIKPPIKPRRTIVDYRKKVPGTTGKLLSLNYVNGIILYVSEKQTGQINKNELKPPAQAIKNLKLEIKAISAHIGSSVTVISDGQNLNLFSSDLTPRGVLKGVTPIEYIEQDGWYLYLHRKDGGTLVANVSNQYNPEIIAEYRSGNSRRHLKVRGRKAFRAQGKTLQLYRVSTRRIDRDKLNRMTRDNLKPRST
jgi:hypothetical protein